MEGRRIDVMVEVGEDRTRDRSVIDVEGVNRVTLEVKEKTWDGWWLRAKGGAADSIALFPIFIVQPPRVGVTRAHHSRNNNVM